MLGLLRQFGSMNGNVLALTAKTVISEYWTITRSQVYRELDKLAKNGLVDAMSADHSSVRTFTISKRGEEAFMSWLKVGPGNDMIRMPLMLTVRFGALLPEGHLEQILKEYAEHHQEKLTWYRELESRLATDATNRYDVATLRFGIIFEEAIRKWIDELPSLLRDPPS